MINMIRKGYNMEYTPEQRAAFIISECEKCNSTDPYKIFHSIANNDHIRMHGPEHHVLDGACILAAFYNAGGKINLHESLIRLMNEGLRMPGGVCGLWGVCGAVTSIGAALAIIDGTGPLSSEDWSSHMEYTSSALSELSKTGGPRCCKRDAFISMKEAVKYIFKNYEVVLDISDIKCDFSALNNQCIGERCPFKR